MLNHLEKLWRSVVNCIQIFGYIMETNFYGPIIHYYIEKVLLHLSIKCKLYTIITIMYHPVWGTYYCWSRLGRCPTCSPITHLTHLSCLLHSPSITTTHFHSHIIYHHASSLVMSSSQCYSYNNICYNIINFKYLV